RAPVTALRKDGTEIPVEISISKFEMEGLQMVTAIVRDTTQRAEMMKELRRAAYEDPLTGIYNRRHMSRIMHRELQRVQRFDRYFSVMMIDLDHFKKINDTYGHAIGDELLMAFVAKVKQVTRSVDVFGRWGGEEFILLLPETRAEDAEVAAEKIRSNLRGDKESQDELYGLTASYGIAQVDQQEQTIESILERVDAALYQAKSDGRDCIRRR
ncbi:MAG: GGDEF domain-containing protein, partial [Motiliproteus sp.]|nr:GGDEF domain-containing protein [Motiliproteus sp.]